MNNCEACGASVSIAGRGRIRRFCSGRCRVAAHRAKRRLPAELTSRPRWVRRAFDKRPITTDGRAASATDPATWSGYGAAAQSQDGVGLGFVLNGDGVACIDIDHCLEDGRPIDWVRELLGALPETYVEVSPSGDGLHVWGWAKILRGRRIPFGDGAVEFYGTGRYITVTGRRHGDAPNRLADLSEVVHRIAA